MKNIFRLLTCHAKKTKFGNNLPQLMLVELPEPRLGVDKARKLSFLCKQLNNDDLEKLKKQFLEKTCFFFKKQ